MNETYISQSPDETKKIAQNLLLSHKKIRFWCLEGTLGSGKTVFSKGLAIGLGIPEKEIKSPTYTFVREYRGKNIRLLHFDFYRIESIDDLMAHDVLEMFTQANTWVIVEWPDRVKHLIPKRHMYISFEHRNEKERLLTISQKE